MLTKVTHRPFDPGIGKTRISSVENYLTQTKYRNQTRCGILPFISINNQLYICFGKDLKSGDYTDFGGSIHKDEQPLHCAIREFYEETRGVFGRLKIEDLFLCNCLYNKKMLIVLIDIFTKSSFESSLELLKDSLISFRSMRHIPEESRTDSRYNEIKAISWINEDIMENVFVHNGYALKIYTRVRKFLRSCKEFSSSLENMKKCLR